MKPSENINGEIKEVIDSLTAVISDVSNIKAVIPENKGLKGVISNNDKIIASVETEVIDINASVINETEELQGSIGIPYLVKGNNDRVSAENVFFNEESSTEITLDNDYIDYIKDIIYVNEDINYFEYTKKEDAENSFDPSMVSGGVTSNEATDEEVNSIFG